MRRLRVLMVYFVLMTVLFVAASAGGPDKAGDGRAALDPRLQGLAWMQGGWTRTDGGDELEEVWSAPGGDSMMGMFRWSKQGKVWMFELITVTLDDDDVVFRLKHFDRKQVGWEEKDESLTFTLVRHGEREAIFENPARDHPRRITYRGPDADTLVVILEGLTDGKPDVTEFRFQRAARRSGSCAVPRIPQRYSAGILPAFGNVMPLCLWFSMAAGAPGGRRSS